MALRLEIELGEGLALGLVGEFAAVGEIVAEDVEGGELIEAGLEYGGGLGAFLWLGEADFRAEQGEG